MQVLHRPSELARVTGQTPHVVSTWRSYESPRIGHRTELHGLAPPLHQVCQHAAVVFAKTSFDLAMDETPRKSRSKWSCRRFSSKRAAMAALRLRFVRPPFQNERPNGFGLVLGERRDLNNRVPSSRQFGDGTLRLRGSCSRPWVRTLAALSPEGRLSQGRGFSLRL